MQITFLIDVDDSLYIAKKDAEGRVPSDLPQINTRPIKKGATG